MFLLTEISLSSVCSVSYFLLINVYDYVLIYALEEVFDLSGSDFRGTLLILLLWVGVVVQMSREDCGPSCYALGLGL